MKDVEQRAAAKSFARDWKGKGYEKGDTHSFWISFLQDVMGVERATNYVEFEKEVIIGGNTKFVDVYIPDTKVVIEQKSLEKSLSKPAKQSDGSVLTPFEQAKNYANYLPADEYPKWIITCNFGEFQIYNMNKPGEAPTKILLSELPKRYSEFSFLVDEKKDYQITKRTAFIKGGPSDCRQSPGPVHYSGSFSCMTLRMSGRISRYCPVQCSSSALATFAASFARIASIRPQCALTDGPRS